MVKVLTWLCVGVEDDPAGHQSSRTWPTFPWYTLYWHGEGPGIVSLLAKLADPMVPDRKILALGNVIKEGGVASSLAIAWRGHPPGVTLTYCLALLSKMMMMERPHFQRLMGSSDPAAAAAVNRQNNHSIQNQTHSHHHIVACWSKSLQVYIRLEK